jgi:hypothetical protein
MAAMKQNLVRNLAVLGAVMVIASVAFEYVRMAPSYRFVVEPWSFRGYELTQGKVVAAIGISLLALLLLAASDRGSTLFNAGVGFGVWLAAVLISQFPDPSPIDLELEAFAAIVIMLALAYILGRGIVNVLADRLPPNRRRLTSLGTLVVLFLVGYLAIARPNFVDPNSTEVELSVIVAVVVGVITISAATAQPRELAAARIAINATLIGWVTVATVGGGARTYLIQHQLETIGVSGTYRDTQITSGLMIAFAGMLIAFLASVGIWARKRDRLLVKARAERQHQAAKDSAAELDQSLAAG